MSRFQDVEQFARQHQSCGALTPTTSAPVMGGYLLTLTCTCGQTFDRWVSAEEAETTPPEAAGPVPGKPTASPAATPGPGNTEARPRAEERARPEPPRTELPTAGGESLEDLMKQALEAVDKPAPRASGTQGAASPPRRAPLEPPPPIVEAKAATQPPKTQPPPAPAAPAASGGEKESLEVLMKRALEALDAEESTAPAGASPGRPAAAGAPKPDAEEPVSTRATPDKQGLQDALRSALEQFDAEKKGGVARPVPRRAATAQAAEAEAQPAPRSPMLPIVIGVVIAVAGAIGAWQYVERSKPATHAATGAASPARPRLGEAERTAANGALTALRDLQSITRPDVPFRIYFNRVEFAKLDVDRHTANVKDQDVKIALQQALAVHFLAATAWRAKTLNERDKWEAVGDDPGIELCPAVKRVSAIAEEPSTMTRSQWRGIAVAAAIPFLWDCASDRLNEIDRSLKDR